MRCRSCQAFGTDTFISSPSPPSRTLSKNSRSRRVRLGRNSATSSSMSANSRSLRVACRRICVSRSRRRRRNSPRWCRITSNRAMAARYFSRPVPFDRLESAQQISIVGDQRVPDSGRDLLDQVRVPCSFAQREPDLLDQVPVAFGMDLGPGLTIPGSASIDQDLVGSPGLTSRPRPGLRPDDRPQSATDGHCRSLPVAIADSMAVTLAVSLAEAVALAVAVAIVLAVQRLGDVRSNSSRAWHCDLAVWTVVERWGESGGATG